jgi:hypothetical protein
LPDPSRNCIKPDTWLQIKGRKNRHVQQATWNFVPSLPRYAVTIIGHCSMLLQLLYRWEPQSRKIRKADNSLNSEDWIGDEACLMNIETGISVTVSSHDVFFGLPKIKPSWPYALHMVWGKSLAAFEVSIRDAGLGMMPLRTWAFITKTTGKFILVLDVLRTCDSCWFRVSFCDWVRRRYHYGILGAWA